MTAAIGDIVRAEDLRTGGPVWAVVLTVVDGGVLDMLDNRGQILSFPAEKAVP